MEIVNWLSRGIDRLQQGVDRFQQRFMAYPFAVGVKFSDDQAGNLAALMTYYAFISIFPLFLVLATVLGFVLKSHPGLQAHLLHSAAVDFPLIGTQLKTTGLRGNLFALVISLVIVAWGAQGVARSIQTAFNTLWNVPFTDRPNFGVTILRSFGLLSVMGLSILATGLLSGVGSLNDSLGITLRIVAFIGSAAINIGSFLLAFRLATARSVPFRCFMRGAIIAALIWQALLAAVSLLVEHEVRHAQELYGTFGIVLGLLAWLHLQSLLTLLAVEADVVRVRRLWPRSAVPPLTHADRLAYSDYAKTTMRRPDHEVNVDVQFSSDFPVSTDVPVGAEVPLAAAPEAPTDDPRTKL